MTHSKHEHCLTRTQFYTNSNIKTHFKRYIEAVVSRYKDSPAIMAWELGNEPRCGADGTRNLPRSPAGCTAAVLTAWIAEMSAYIKTLDAHHLVTWGGEGAFNRAGSSDWMYTGGDGGDFDAELAVDSVDFGVFHSYPDWWSKTPAWTEQWIKDHGAAGNSKPVVHEEYGWLESNSQPRTEILARWQAVSLGLEMSDMFWQFGFSGYSTGRNHNDGFTIYVEDDEAQSLVYDHAAAVNAANGKGPATTVVSPTPTATATPTSTAPASPGQTHWGQCGGQGWSGPTVCLSPLTCVVLGQWYSQCQ
jgi:mannan endo-1,4-beta-mannosidase